MTPRSGIFPAIIVLSSFLLAAADRGSAQSDGFPLEQGTYWIYECVTTRKGVNSPPVQKSLFWRMEILETMRQRDLIIALVRGHLDDVPGPNEPKRRDYLVVAVRNNAFYLVAPPNSQDLLNHLKQTQTTGRRWCTDKPSCFLNCRSFPEAGFRQGKARKKTTARIDPDSILGSSRTRRG
jgi:hypothetical protein